ncbi:HK97 family phage major capsid protein [Anaerosolibacter carboniphilus]|uniref:HK97 family phage major capsid protein n=1 Tax=Anaerosolibacter carboniphilus TaxID=1417629 RepID=A0A841L716_9FIRM|nr:phage major capsid protein [Anaerosolibacter carboniphilus]MBB6218189.1 HK97 family phage major capsid protein [Anaerosolibacter carboniphilus]
MKKRLLKLLQTKEARKTDLGTRSAATNDIGELRGINSELDTLNAEIAELRSMIDALPDEPDEQPEQRGNELHGTELRGTPNGSVNILGTYGIGGKGNEQRSLDRFDTVEYRSAFQEYVTTGKKSDNLEFRADAVTGTGDIGVVIPTTILNRIVEKMKDYGHIWARVTKTGIQGGVEIPVSNAKPTATWVAAGTMADKKKKAVSGKISFSYHKLQVRVAVELVAGTVAMPVFEQTVSDNIYEAMITALEEAIISGTGEGQPLGITVDTNIPAAQILEIAVEDMGKYDTWTGIFGKLPRKYRSRAILILNDADWNQYIVGMTDVNGQPIARVTYGLDGTQQERFLGKEVLPVEDYLPSISDALEGDIFGIVCNLSDYMVNSNMQMTFKRYFDEDKDEWISKSTMICDGKLADRNGVVLLKKKASA